LAPEQLVGRMKRDIKLSISHETVYKFFYKNEENGDEIV
jgi:IS30 family transposase